MRIAGSFVVGVGAGIISAAMGIGGAVVSTPAIRVFLKTPAIVAVGTTLPVIIPTTLTGLLAYARSELVDWRLAATAAPAGGVFAVLGALLTKIIPGELLLVATGGLMLVFAWRMYPRKLAIAPTVRTPSVLACVVVGAASGFVAGLLGVGGGLVLVPVFSEILGLDVKRAVGTSLAIVTAQAIPGTVVHAWLGHVDWAIVAGLTAGVIPGAWASSRLAVRLQDRTLRIVLSSGMVVLGLVFAASELRAFLS